MQKNIFHLLQQAGRPQLYLWLLYTTTSHYNYKSSSEVILLLLDVMLSHLKLGHLEDLSTIAMISSSGEPLQGRWWTGRSGSVHVP